jgi:hypothetical protein
VQESRSDIGNMALGGVYILSERHVYMSHLKFLQLVNDRISHSASMSSVPPSCLEVGTMLVKTIRRNDQF